MSIADDIEEVLQEVGTALTIHHPDNTVTTGLYVDPEGYPDSSTLFIRMFLRSGSVAASAPIDNGQLVEFGDCFYLVTNLVPTMFESASVEQIAIFYLCNVQADLFHHLDAPSYDSNYAKLPEWTSLGTAVRGCFIEKSLLPLPEIKNDTYLTGSITNILYLSADYDMKRGDRIVLANGDRFMIETVSPHELKGILVCGVGEDNR